jgi:hypothetical protein
MGSSSGINAIIAAPHACLYVLLSRICCKIDCRPERSSPRGIAAWAVKDLRLGAVLRTIRVPEVSLLRTGNAPAAQLVVEPVDPDPAAGVELGAVLGVPLPLPLVSFAGATAGFASAPASLPPSFFVSPLLSEGAESDDVPPLFGA